MGEREGRENVVYETKNAAPEVRMTLEARLPGQPWRGTDPISLTDREAVTDVRLRGGKYRVVSAYFLTPDQVGEFKGKFGSRREVGNLVPGEKGPEGRAYQPGVPRPPLDGLPSAPGPTVRLGSLEGKRAATSNAPPGAPPLSCPERFRDPGENLARPEPLFNARTEIGPTPTTEPTPAGERKAREATRGYFDRIVRAYLSGKPRSRVRANFNEARDADVPLSKQQVKRAVDDARRTRAERLLRQTRRSLRPEIGGLLRGIEGP